MTEKFNVGDRVKVNETVHDRSFLGQEGTVVEVDVNYAGHRDLVKVKMDNPVLFEDRVFPGHFTTVPQRYTKIGVDPSEWENDLE